MNKWHVDYTKDGYEVEWKETRRRILKRDRYHCRIFACTVKGAKNLTVHHVIPRDEDGSDNDANLITLCPKHHDEIEVARIRQVTLIEAWEGTDETSSGAKGETRIILAHVSGQGTSTGELAVDNSAQGTPETIRTPQHKCESSTVAELAKRLEGSTLSEVAKSLRYPPKFASTISAIMHCKRGAISVVGEDELRRRMKLDPIAPGGYKRRSFSHLSSRAKPGRPRGNIDAEQLATARLLVAVTHNKLGSWDAVASYYGISKAAAHRIANDKTYRPSQTTIDKVLAAQPSKPSPKRAPRRFYRPCLSVELGEAIREDRIDLESLLWTVIVAGRQERKKRAA